METPLKYYTIRNQADDEGSAEILLYGDIGDSLWSEGTGAKQFAEDLKKCGKVGNLNIRINSPGGSVFEGLAIYNTLERHSAKKTVTIDGLAASIASVIAMAGDTVVMPKNAVMMVHDPLAMTVGNAEDHRKMAEGLDKIKTGLISAYAKKTKMSNQDIADLMSDETWMTANEAVEWGFADEVAEPMRMAASMNFDLSAYKNVPKNIFAKSERRTNHMENEQIEHTRFLSRQQSERERSNEILEIGKVGSCLEEAVAAVQSGSTVEEFRKFVMSEMQKKIVPIGPLYPIEDSDELLAKVPYGTGTRDLSRGSGPFRTLGQQLQSIVASSSPGGKIDPKLYQVRNAAGLNEKIPSEGGWLVQPEFSYALLQKANETGILASKCYHIPIGGNFSGIELPVIDETSRADGSRWGGIQAYWLAEAAEKQPSKPKFGRLSLTLSKLVGLCYTSDELLADAGVLQAIVTDGFSQEIGFRMDDAILNGTGVGQPLGILNSSALVVVTKEVGQAATLVFENLVKMWARCYGRSRKNAIWLLNQDTEVQLFSLGIIVGMGGSSVYMPAGGLSASPYSTLFGRPIIPLEQCGTLGAKGDIILFDPSQYLVIDKGVESDVSIHLRFLYDESTFRFVYRVDGAPIWKSALIPFKGAANTQSPYVTLQAR